MSGNTLTFAAETSACPLTFFKGAQSVGTSEYWQMAVVFESQPPFYTSYAEIKHYLVRCGGAFSHWRVVKSGALGGLTLVSHARYDCQRLTARKDEHTWR